MEQHNAVRPKQQELLRRSFDFLLRSREVLEQKKFLKLVKMLVEYDKGSVEVPALVQTAATCLLPHNDLIDLFKDFLPDKAKPLLSKLIR